MKSAGYPRVAAAVAVGTAILLLFGIGALGIIGSGGRPDLVYVAVLAVGLLGAIIVRFRVRGMALTLAGTAVATVLVGVVAVVLGLNHDRGASAVDTLSLSAMYGALFGLSGWLYRRAELTRS